MDTILNYARLQGYSDIHINSQGSIMMRHNGILIPFEHHYSFQELNEMILSLLTPLQKEHLLQGQDIDKIYVLNNERYRINVYRERGNICVAMRIINSQIRSIDELGLPVILKSLSLEQRGLILVTGPTGSGKSTTLSAMIHEINHFKSCHILTIEDPIEYVYQQEQALIHQREIGTDVSSYDIALKSALREDPDVILVGEMRDHETIQAVMTLAETGHLVFSTLHTMGVAKTIDRIIDVFPSHQQSQIRTQLSSVLKAVITQQLIPSHDAKKRVVAMEIMINTPAIAHLIRENKGHQINHMIQTGIQLGMLPFNVSLLSLYQQGDLTLAEVKKYSDNLEELQRMIDIS